MSEENVISKKENDKNGSGTTTTTTKTTVVTKTLVLGLPRLVNCYSPINFGFSEVFPFDLLFFSYYFHLILKKYPNFIVWPLLFPTYFGWNYRSLL